MRCGDQSFVGFAVPMTESVDSESFIGILTREFDDFVGPRGSLLGEAGELGKWILEGLSSFANFFIGDPEAETLVDLAGTGGAGAGGDRVSSCGSCNRKTVLDDGAI